MNVEGHRFIALVEEPSPVESCPTGSSEGAVHVLFADGDGSSARAIHTQVEVSPVSRPAEHDGYGDNGDPNGPSSRAQFLPPYCCLCGDVSGEHIVTLDGRRYCKDFAACDERRGVTVSRKVA